MPSYVSGKDLKSAKDRIFNPSESDYMNKKNVVKKVIEKFHGEHRRQKLEKALNKMNTEEVVMLGMVVEMAIQKEIDERLLRI
mgnify:CR=1 FL=1